MLWFRKKSAVNPIVVGILVCILTVLMVIFAIRLLPSGEVKAFAIGPEYRGEDVAFVVKAFQGKVAVFLEGEENPAIVLDTVVATLPFTDQEELSKGIKIKGSDALRQAIEDLTS